MLNSHASSDTLCIEFSPETTHKLSIATELCLALQDEADAAHHISVNECGKEAHFSHQHITNAVADKSRGIQIQRHKIKCHTSNNELAKQAPSIHQSLLDKLVKPPDIHINDKLAKSPYVQISSHEVLKEVTECELGFKQLVQFWEAKTPVTAVPLIDLEIQHNAKTKIHTITMHCSCCDGTLSVRVGHECHADGEGGVEWSKGSDREQVTLIV